MFVSSTSVAALAWFADFVSFISVQSSPCPSFVLCILLFTIAGRQLELSAGVNFQGASQTLFPQLCILISSSGGRNLVQWEP